MVRSHASFLKPPGQSALMGPAAPVPAEPVPALGRSLCTRRFAFLPFVSGLVWMPRVFLRGL